MSSQSLSLLPAPAGATPEALKFRIQEFSKFKERSHLTYHNIHLPELNARLSLNLPLPPPAARSSHERFAPTADLKNTNKIEVIYLGNSMLERLKNTGRQTELGKFQTSWNAGCGGDKTPNIAYRLNLGMHNILKQHAARDIKVWILASGTNNLRPNRPFSAGDVESYRVIVEACLDIAPESTVLACDMFYRKDIPDEITDASNKMLENVVRQINVDLGEEKVRWVESRQLVGKHLLVDHVHLNGEGYRIWDGELWPLINEILQLRSGENEERQ